MRLAVDIRDGGRHGFVQPRRKSYRVFRDKVDLDTVIFEEDNLGGLVQDYQIKKR